MFTTISLAATAVAGIALSPIAGVAGIVVTMVVLAAELHASEEKNRERREW